MFRYLTFIILLFAASCTHSATVLQASDFSMRADGSDCSPAMQQMLEKAKANKKGKCVINIPKGVYHFYPQSARKVQLHISNHDQPPYHPVGVPMIGLQNVTLKAYGSTFMFHGLMQPVMVKDSNNTTIRDLHIDYATPYYSEGIITQTTENTTTVRIPKKFRFAVENDRYHNCGEGWKEQILSALGFQADGAMVATGKSGDVGWNIPAKQVGEREVEFQINAKERGFKPGHIMLLRGHSRPHPAMVLDHAKNTTLRNVYFHSSQGMGLLAQLSRDIRIIGGGCVRGDARVHTVSADATHFSNCAGKIEVRNALYEGMMDDAINVHSTCLQINKVLSPKKLELKFMHRQAIGLPLFKKGSRLQYINAETLENTQRLGTVATVEYPDTHTIILTLKQAIPAGISAGDAVECADWYPSVHFHHNTVRHNRARGTLFTTPKQVLVEHNQFIGCSGSPILLAGDCNGWFESGACREVIIRHNLFDNNLFCRYQFTEGIISIYPEVPQLQNQKERYHQNIRIEDNTFRTHRVPLLYAISAANITLRRNTVEWNDNLPATHDGKPIILHHCDNFISDNPNLQPQ